MAQSHRFLSSEGLMPSTIFDRGGDTDMDISEEMEEIRELLYELIKKNFPMGVSSAHLAEKYHEEYVSKGLGRELPSDWLEQVAAAEEFEAQTRGPLTILFVRLSNTNSFKRPPVPLTNVRIISSVAPPPALDAESVKARKEKYPLEHAQALSKTSENVAAQKDVLVVAYDSAEELYIRATEDGLKFSLLKSDLKKFYAECEADFKVLIYEILSGGAYALCDGAGDWFRVIAEDSPRSGKVACFFVDVGVRGSFAVGDLRLLPDPSHPIMQVPALATRVSLGLQKTGEQIDNIMRDILFEKDLVGNLVPNKIQLKSMDTNGNLPEGSQGIVDLWTTDGRAVREVAMDRIKEQVEQSVVSPPRQFVSPSPIVQPLQAAASAVSPISSSSVSSVLPTGCVFDGDAEILPMAVSQMPSTAFLANALFAAGPTDISLRQVSLDPMPDYMYAKLAEECELPEARLPPSGPQTGRHYAAMIDGRWERVQCLRASKIDKAAFCVYLIDVGAFHYVRGDAMRRLNAKTPFKKMLMFKCKLADIVPVEGTDIWSRESHEAVREFFESRMGEPIQVTPVSSGWSQWKQLNAPSVPVVEAKLSCCGRDLGEWLLGCGLARHVRHTAARHA